MRERWDVWWIQVKDPKPNPRKGRPTVARVKQAVSILDLLRYFGVDADMRGRDRREWVAVRCPFHRDTKPSASVNAALGRFRCHGVCDFGGDVIDVVSWRYGLTRREALDWLSERFM